jgi:CheY-like chemotaxis protein
VLVADADVNDGKRTASLIASWGLEPILVHDGVEALLTIQRALPRVVILDAALPKMFGFQVCEMVKRNESLREIQVVLLGAIHHRDRYRRPPRDLYGADAYLERPDLANELAAVLQRCGLNVGQGASAPPPVATPPIAPNVEPAAAPEAAPAAAVAPPAPVPTPAAEPPRAADDPLADERAKAERLARIIVSDIVLYNPEQFERALQTGNVVQALESGLQEGRELFRQRVDERVRNERDYLEDELLRVARDRSSR